MAYGELYRFVFEAANGPEVTISVAKKDYTGAVSSRAVGGSAVLKRERSGHILGSSLEWAAECLVEDEFADLYTSDPTLYQVTVKFGASRVWRGFITPELYSAPWVNAPYDITLTASDNLSELKNYDFEEQGNKTVRELLVLLLAKTNQGITNITAISSLSGDGESLINLTVNVDALAGSTYYDVLDSLLESLHACIWIDSGTLSWIVSRETDISNYSGISYVALSSLSGSGQMFPIGNLSIEIEPARKELRVSEEIHAANVAKSFNSANVVTLRDKPKWITSEYGSTVELTSAPAFAMAGTPERIDSIAGTLFTKLVSGRRYTLTFRAQNSGFFVGKTVLKWGLLITDGKGRAIYYDDNGNYTATYPGNDYPLSQELTPDFAEYSYNFVIPQKVGSSDFAPAQGSFSARCVREGDGATVWSATAKLADVRLSVSDFPDGLSTRVVLDNSARSAGDEVNLQFGADMAQARLNAIQEKKFTSAAITTAQDFNAFMAIDNALSVATPRLRLSGIVMFKTAAAWRLPKFIRTTHTTADNLEYIVEQYSFNLITGEIDLSMLSLPAVALSYTELTTSNVYGQSSGGSGSSAGTAGPQGPKGDKGDKGDPGTNGTSATITGATAEYDMLNEEDGPKVDVKATGTATARAFRFIFSGLKGEQGEPGNPGGKGDPGESAYEIALRQGYADNLTESEWVASLKGDKGDTGAAAGFATPTAEAFYIAGGDPTAEVTASGPDTAKKFAFRFGIPKASEVIDSQARLRVRPVLRVVRGYTPEDIERNVLSVEHPALSSDKYEAMLMVYQRMNKRRRYFYDGTNTKKVRLARKGWFAALGDKKITDHAAFTVAGFSGAKGVNMGLSELRDFIVKRFMTDSGHTKAELWSRNYAQWAAESNVKRGFGSFHAARKTFGIAVRWVNPSFTALVDPSKPLSPTTMELTDSKGNAVPRYIYSDVAPLTVELQNRGAAKRASMWFGVSG